MSDQMTPEERRLNDLFRQVDAPASLRRWESAADSAPSPRRRRRWWLRLPLALVSAGGERRLRPLAAALVLPLLVLAVGGGLQLRAHFRSATVGSGVTPVARDGAAMAFDAAHGQVVMFGGRGADGVALGDTRTWDGESWTQLHPATSPSPRGNAAMAFDTSRGVMVLFGGSANSPFGSGEPETWTWNGSDWHRVQTAHTPVSASAGMVYDAARNQLVLLTMMVGPAMLQQGVGHAVPGVVAPLPAQPADTPAVTSPQPVLPGGRGPIVIPVSPPPPVSVSVTPLPAPVPDVETWTWTGSDWQRHSPLSSPTGWPNLASMAWDANAKHTLLVTNGAPLNCNLETSSFSSFGSVEEVPAPQPASAAGSSQGSAGWSGYWPAQLPPSSHPPTQMPPVANTQPLPPPHMASTPAICNMEVSVGSLGSGVHCSGCPIAHEWAWDGATWHEVSLGDAVSFSGEQMVSDPRSGHALAIDSSHFWTWNGTRWTPHLLPAGLRVRQGMALAADTQHANVVLFGGRVAGTPAADTWTWDGSTWTHRAGPVLPAPTPYTSPPPPSPMFTAQPAPLGQECPTDNVSASRQPDGAVSISVSVRPRSAECPDASATVELIDVLHGNLAVQGNGFPVGAGTSSFLWRNWCHPVGGKVAVRLGNRGLLTVVSQLPTCVDNHEPSTLTLSSSQTTATVPTPIP